MQQDFLYCVKLCQYEADHGLKATDGTDFGTSLDRVAKRGNYVKEILETCTITPPNGLGIKDYSVLTTPPTEALIRYIVLLQNAADAENWAVAMVAMIPCVQVSLVLSRIHSP